jgi:hypothetical protein
MERVLTALALLLALGLTACQPRADRSTPAGDERSGPAAATTPSRSHVGVPDISGVDADLSSVDSLLDGADRQLDSADRTPEDVD